MGQHPQIIAVIWFTVRDTSQPRHAVTKKTGQYCQAHTATRCLGLQNNMFVEVVLPEMGTLRTLTDAERQTYRAPYPTPESRKPTLVWPREVPIAGVPVDVLAITESNGAWLHETNIPKLMFYADPGAFGGPEVAAYFAKNLKNIETNYVGPGTHYIQEDHPHEIGRELADWLRRQK